MKNLAPVASQVQNAIADGNIELALEVCEQALRAGNTELRIEYGFLLWQLYDYPRAKTVFEELIADRATTARTLQRIAKCFFRLGRFPAAAQVMQQAALKSSNDVEVLLQFASCLERSDQLEPAIDVCHQGLFVDPSQQGLVRQLAHIERRQGHLNEAIERLYQFLVEFSWAKNWQVKYELASCLDRTGEYRDAWLNLVDAKMQLREQSLHDLKLSYARRRRQAAVVESITEVDWRRWKKLSPIRSQSIALMGGFPRSGTTLLETVLTSHPQVEGTDESGILTSQFIQPMIWEAADPIAAVMELRGFEPDQIDAGREQYFRCTKNVLNKEIQHKTLIEKDPLLTCDLPLPLRLFPEARLIMPLRDPRDVLVSYFFTMLPFSWNSSPATDIVESAKFYSDVMRHWLMLRNRIPWESIEVRYEDFVDDPVTETTRLSNFLQLEFQPSMLDPSRRRKDKMVSTPTYDDVTKPIYRRALGRWENYREFMEPTLPMLEPFCKAFEYE